MLPPSKLQKLQQSLKDYRKKFLDGKITELDESGTRIMINVFLSDVLGYAPLEEIKTEYMIKGTYADYVVQINKTRHFLVEVKALSFDLSEKHLRQTINYGANEGIEYALLTNGRSFDFYKIIFEQPISQRLIFSLDLSDQSKLKESIEYLQHLHRDSVVKNSFEPLWNKCEATDSYNIAGILLSEPVTDLIRKLIKQKYDEKCEDDVIIAAVEKIIMEKMDPLMVRPFKAPRSRAQRPAKNKPTTMVEKGTSDVKEPDQSATES